MPATRSTKDKDAGTRKRLIEATAQVIRDEGMPRHTTRRIAAVAGVAVGAGLLLLRHPRRPVHRSTPQRRRRGPDPAARRHQHRRSAASAVADQLRLAGDRAQHRVHGAGQSPQGDRRRAQGLLRARPRHRGRAPWPACSAPTVWTWMEFPPSSMSMLLTPVRPQPVQRRGGRRDRGPRRIRAFVEQFLRRFGTGGAAT